MRLAERAKQAAKSSIAYYLFTVMKGAARLANFRIRFGIESVYSATKHASSSLPIDLVIPVVDKDAETLPFVIDSAREFIRHPIKDFYLVCPGDSVRVKEIAREKNCKIVDEKDLVPISPKDIEYFSHGKDRSGWMYQQFLKWSGSKFCSQRHYLVMDSDTVFIRPQVFEIEGRMVFDFCDGLHKPYFEAFERIFGIKPLSTLSFTSHHALIDTEVVDGIIRDIEALHKMPWYKAIVGAIDANQKSSISDYDNYALYLFEKIPSRMCARYWNNASFLRQSLKDLARLKTKYRNRYSTISFHSYNT